MRLHTLTFAALCAAGGPVFAGQQCLIQGQNCKELHEYLTTVSQGATIADMHERVGEILMAEFYPDYPKTNAMRCNPVDKLQSLLAGKSYQRLMTPFPPATHTQPLIEYLVEDGARYCYVAHENSGTN